MARTVRDKYAVAWKWKKTLTTDSGWWMFPGRACQLVLDARVEPGPTLIARSWPEFNSTQLSSNTISIVHGLPPNLPEQMLQIFWLSMKTCTPMHTSLSGPRGLVARFSCEYDGHIFKDEKGPSFRHLFSGLELKTSRFVSIHKGNESQAVVSFAPYQKLPLEEKRWTVETRPSIKVRRYFLDTSLAQSSESGEEYIAFLQPSDAPSTKPHGAD
jgi:hypothetical protein